MATQGRLPMLSRTDRVSWTECDPCHTSIMPFLAFGGKSASMRRPLLPPLSSSSRSQHRSRQQHVQASQRLEGFGACC